MKHAARRRFPADVRNNVQLGCRWDGCLAQREQWFAQPAQQADKRGIVARAVAEHDHTVARDNPRQGGPILRATREALDHRAERFEPIDAHLVEQCQHARVERALSVGQRVDDQVGLPEILPCGDIARRRNGDDTGTFGSDQADGGVLHR